MEKDTGKKAVWRTSFAVSVVGGLAAEREVQSKIAAIGEALGEEYQDRGRVNRSAVILKLIDDAYAALVD